MGRVASQPVDLPRPGIEPMSPGLAGGFLTTGPPGKSLPFLFLFHKIVYLSAGNRWHIQMG